MKTFLSLVSITIKEGMFDGNLGISGTANKAIDKPEDDTWFNNFDRHTNEQYRFVWTDVYRKSDNYLFHVDNLPVQEYVEKHGELAINFSIEISGNFTNEVIEKING